MADTVPLINIYIDHSNMWGGARWASKINDPKIEDGRARLSVKNLNRILVKRRLGVDRKVVSGGVPPGMEGVWAEYQLCGYDTQRLFRDKHWREHGVDHSLIGHIWRQLARHKGDGAEIILVIGSGDGKTNEFGTSFFEVIEEALTRTGYERWRVELASFDGPGPPNSPTSRRMRALVEKYSRGTFINLADHYKSLVYHVKETIRE